MYSMDYYLLMAQNLKLTGYSKISVEYEEALEELKKSAGTKKDWHLNISHYYTNKHVKRYRIEKFTYNSISAKSPITADNNELIRYIYTKSIGDVAYRDLGFLLFLTGVVNSFDYLKHNRDVVFVVSRLGLDDERHFLDGSKDMTIKAYMKLMGAYIFNSSRGTRYTYSIYDFVYQFWLKYTRIFALKDLYGWDWYDSLFNRFDKIGVVSIEEFIKQYSPKYGNEFLMCLPMLLKKAKLSEIPVLNDMFWYTVGNSNGFATNLIECLLSYDDVSNLISKNYISVKRSL